MTDYEAAQIACERAAEKLGIAIAYLRDAEFSYDEAYENLRRFEVSPGVPKKEFR